MAPSFTIQISSNLVNRILGDEIKKQKTEKPKPKNSQEPQQLLSKGKPAPDMPTKCPGEVWPLQTPVFSPVAPPPVAIAELEAVRSVQQESERVVVKPEKQESNMLQKLNRGAKELNDKEFKQPYRKPTPCSTQKEACLQCYKEHAEDPLKCAQMVQNFVDCARRLVQRVS